MRSLAALTVAWMLMGGAADSFAANKMRVFVSILPQAGLVERIGGDRVQVEVLVGPGQSPATYEPSPRQMGALSRARLYIRMGVPFERGFLERLRSTFPGLVIIDQRDGVPMLSRTGKPLAGPRPDLDAADPHIWLDPKRLPVQARNIANALARVLPDRRQVFETNLEKLNVALRALDGQVGEVLRPFRGQSLFVFHPAFTYFCDSYGLEQVAVETGGKQPGAKQMARLIERARNEKARVIFVQPQFSRKSAQQVAKAISGAVVPMNPLARDLLENFHQMASLVQSALQRRAP